MESQDLFVCGGCNAKIGPGHLDDILSSLPEFSDPNLLVGFDSTDDAAVIMLRPDLAIIETLDFFPPMVTDPYLFGKIAAANAMSDVYAMGGEVLSALNIVAYPEEEELDGLRAILQGGYEKVKEAGAILSGGHSIHDRTVKYGLSVTGTVHPDKLWRNNTCQVGDHLLLTKPLGVGIVTAGYWIGEVDEESYDQATTSMQTLNKYAHDLLIEHTVHSCTDVTGFGLLGHLSEMLGSTHSATIDVTQLPYIEGAYAAAENFVFTAGGQRNRNFLESEIDWRIEDNAIEELLFDPQTSGGLLVSVPESEVAAIQEAFAENDLLIANIGRVTSRRDHAIIVE